MEYSRNGIPSTSFSKYGASCKGAGPAGKYTVLDWPTSTWRYVRQQTPCLLWKLKNWDNGQQKYILHTKVHRK